MVFLNVGLKNTTNVGRIDRGLVMGCVLDVRYRVLASIKRGKVEKQRLALDVMICIT